MTTAILAVALLCELPSHSSHEHETGKMCLICKSHQHAANAYKHSMEGVSVVYHCTKGCALGICRHTLGATYGAGKGVVGCVHGSCQRVAGCVHEFKECTFGSWYLDPQLGGDCNDRFHIAPPPHQGYYYFQSYNYRQLIQHAQDAAAMGEDPQLPYSNEVFRRRYRKRPEATPDSIVDPEPIPTEPRPARIGAPIPKGVDQPKPPQVQPPKPDQSGAPRINPLQTQVDEWLFTAPQEPIKLVQDSQSQAEESTAVQAVLEIVQEAAKPVEVAVEPPISQESVKAIESTTLSNADSINSESIPEISSQENSTLNEADMSAETVEFMSTESIEESAEMELGTKLEAVEDGPMLAAPTGQTEAVQEEPSVIANSNQIEAMEATQSNDYVATPAETTSEESHETNSEQVTPVNEQVVIPIDQPVEANSDTTTETTPSVKTETRMLDELSVEMTEEVTGESAVEASVEMTDQITDELMPVECPTEDSIEDQAFYKEPIQPDMTFAGPDDESLVDETEPADESKLLKSIMFVPFLLLLILGRIAIK